MAKKTKIPKRIAGIKIPKSIRKGPIAEFVSSSAGQLLLAEAVLALGGMYAARRFDPSTPTGQALRHPIDELRTRFATAQLGDDAIASAPARIGRACRAAVRAFRAELVGPTADDVTTDEQVEATAAVTEAESEIPKKKSPRSRAASSPQNTSGPH